THYHTIDSQTSYYDNYAHEYKYQNRQDFTYNTYDFNSTGRVQVNSMTSSATSFGIQYYTKHLSSITAEGDFFPAPGLETVGSAAQKVVTTDDYSDSKTLGFYGQEQVGLRERLYLTAAVRVDNNSAFGKDIKWVTYPKASLSWV